MSLRSFFGNVVAASLLLISASVVAQPTISTIAGTGVAGFSGDGGAATSAKIFHPGEIICDASGNIYIAEIENNRIRKISPTGIISTVAGTGVAGFSGDGGPATSAALNAPYGVALDAAGNLYISDGYNYRIRKINTSGIITTVAGNGTSGFSGDGGPATSAQLWNPAFMYVDGPGNIYISDNQNQRIRKVNSSTGIITTIAGNGTIGYSGDGGLATSATLTFPSGLWADNAGNVYICDCLNHAIRKINPAGIITTIAGTGTAGYSGDGGPATSAQINLPQNLYMDNLGNLYFADTHNHRVRKISSSGIISTVAGNGTPGFSGDGGLATAAQLNDPDGVWMDNLGRLLIADVNNQRIRRLSGVNHDPAFTNGATATLHLCVGATATPVDSLLAVLDSDAGQMLTWNTLTAPMHGTLAASYSATSTGGVVVPSGLTYTPTPGYVGTDIFLVKVSDGSATSTITVNIVIDPLPNAGVISGVDSVCPGHSVTLAETVAGGIWSYSNGAITSITFGGVVTGVTPGRDTIIYTVVNACGIVSAIYPFTVRSYAACLTGVNGMQEDAFRLYPNPSAGQFNVFIPSTEGGEASVSLLNVAGQKVAQRVLQTNQLHEVTFDVASGLYFLNIQTAQETRVEKVIITH